MKKHSPSHPQGPTPPTDRPPSGSKPPSRAEQHEHHDHQSAVIDPPNHVAIPPGEVHHPELHRHAALKANALMANVMAEARGARPARATRRADDDNAPLLVLQPSVVSSVLIGPGDEEGLGIEAIIGGVTVRVEPWTPMMLNDTVEIFWGTYPSSATASKTLTLPSDLNRAVLLTVPERIIVAGWVDLMCRVTHANNSQDLSAARRVLVKLDPPGGIDPAPYENTNLAPPMLPTDVMENGVDATWAASGVPVIINAYPNMAAGDRIRLSWGGSHVERTIVDADVDQDVRMIVNDATIRSAGDSDALHVHYQVHDLVNNRSGRSPTTEVEVHVLGNALLPPQVVNADADGVIDLMQLGGDDVRVLVTALAPDFAQGDVVTLNWLGYTEQNVAVSYTATQTVDRAPPMTLEFVIPNASVAALARGYAVVSYSLPNGRTSKQTRVTVTSAAVTALPPPSVDQAVGGRLDADLASATVRIPPYPSMAPGDTVTLVWSGTMPNGDPLLYHVERHVTNSSVGKEIMLSVPAADIAPLAGGTLQVWYEVITVDGTLLPASWALGLRVGSATSVELRPPTVDEAPDGVTLDPDNVGFEVTVRIAPDPNIVAGDRIDMYWTGSSGAGGSFSDWTKVGSNNAGKVIFLYVDKEFVTANDGGTVTVSYTVTKADGSMLTSEALTLQVGEQQEVPPVTGDSDIVVVRADALTHTLNLVKPMGQGPQGPWDTMSEVIFKYDGMRVGDIVTMIVQGPPGFGEYQQSARVSDVSGLWMMLIQLVISPYYNSTVRIGYTVQRNGVPVGPAEPTSWYELYIQNIPLQGIAYLSSANAKVYFCSGPQTEITIPENLPIGGEIFTTTKCQIEGDDDFTVRSTPNPSTYVINWSWGQQPKSDSTLFPAYIAESFPLSSVPGLAFQILFDARDGKGANPLTAGPWIYPEGSFSAPGSIAYMRFIKVGPITSGTLDASSTGAHWYFGSTRALFAYIALYPSVKINVGPPSKHQAALPSSKT